MSINMYMDSITYVISGQWVSMHSACLFGFFICIPIFLKFSFSQFGKMLELFVTVKCEGRRDILLFPDINQLFLLFQKTFMRLLCSGI